MIDTQKLRQRILDLAIRGKLVPQDPNDEPASVLLDRIRAEKERLIAEGKIKRPKAKKSTDKSHYQNFEPPFKIPDSWQWVRLEDIAYSVLGKMLDKSKNKGVNHPYLRNINVRWFEFDLSDLLEMPYQEDEIDRYSILHGDLVICEGGEPGRCAVWDKEEPVMFQKALHRTRFFCGIKSHLIAKILYLYCINGFITKFFTGSGIKHLTGESLATIPIPLPPLKEQERILKSINSLDSIINRIQQNREYLIDTISSIKSKILDLAMQGKLVPQNPADEPAAEMLLRINPKAKIITDNPHSWNIPNGWCWIKVSDVFTPLKRQLPTGEKFWYIDIDSVDNKQNIAYPKNITTDNAPSRASRHTQKGDVLFSMVRPYLRNIALVPHKDCIASTGFYVLHPSGAIDSMFSYLLALSAFFVDGLNSYMKGDNSPSIKKDNIENFVIPLPPLAEQTRIAAKVEELYSVLDEMKASLQS